MTNLVRLLPSQLNADDVERFYEDGYVHLKGVLSSQDVQKLRDVTEQQARNLDTTKTGYDFESLARQLWDRQKEQIDAGEAKRFDLELYRHIIEMDDTARPIRDRINQVSNDEDGLFLYEAAGWREYAGIREVAFDSPLPEMCAELLDTQYLNFWEDTTFVKAPNTPQRTTFHQDYTYFQIRGQKCCIVWIPLDPVTKRNGAMQYVRGSHKWNAQFAPNVFIAQTPLLDAEDPKLPDIEGHPEKYDIVTVESEPGDVIIHHVMTVHGAHGNLSKNDMRRAMSFRYCGDDIRYYNRPGAIPQPYISDPLPNGAPLYSSDYPLVWPKPAPEIQLAPLFSGVSRVA